MGLVHNLRKTRAPDLLGSPMIEGRTKDAFVFEVEVWPGQPDPRVPVLIREKLGERGRFMWEGWLMHYPPPGRHRPWAEITTDGLRVGPEMAYVTGGYREAAANYAEAVVHGIVEAVTYRVATPESVEQGDYEDQGYEVEPKVVAPTFVHYDADQYGPYTADGSSDWFYGEAVADFSTGAETSYNLHLDDLDGRSLTGFGEWDARSHPLLSVATAMGTMFFSEGMERATMELMASRGFYSYAAEWTSYAEAMLEVADRHGYSKLRSPIDYDDYIVFETREPTELLVLQDLLMSNMDFEGVGHIEMPTTRDGKAWIHPGYEAVETEDAIGPGVSGFLLRQTRKNPAPRRVGKKGRVSKKALNKILRGALR